MYNPVDKTGCAQDVRQAIVCMMCRGCLDKRIFCYYFSVFDNGSHHETISFPNREKHIMTLWVVRLLDKKVYVGHHRNWTKDKAEAKRFDSITKAHTYMESQIPVVFFYTVCELFKETK